MDMAMFLIIGVLVGSVAFALGFGMCAMLTAGRAASQADALARFADRRNWKGGVVDNQVCHVWNGDGHPVKMARDALL